MPKRRRLYVQLPTVVEPGERVDVLWNFTDFADNAKRWCAAVVTRVAGNNAMVQFEDQTTGFIVCSTNCNWRRNHDMLDAASDTCSDSEKRERAASHLQLAEKCRRRFRLTKIPGRTFDFNALKTMRALVKKAQAQSGSDLEETMVAIYHAWSNTMPT